jgi:hypothetical protein
VNLISMHAGEYNPYLRRNPSKGAPTVAPVVKILSALYRTSTAFTRARHWSVESRSHFHILIFKLHFNIIPSKVRSPKSSPMYVFPM